MKKLIVFSIVAAGAVTAAGATDGADKFLASKFDEWFAEAKPVGQGVWLTDKNGCLYVITPGAQRLAIVQVLDQAKNPVCRK